MVEFYLSLYDSARFSCKNIGMHFSDGQPSSNIQDLLALEPQFRYEGGFLTDKENWMRISGDFVSEGGENFVRIGDFDGYFNSDTMNLTIGGSFPSLGYWEVAFYLIDDVSVVEDTTYHVGVEDAGAEQEQFSLYRNPNEGAFTVQLDGHSGAETELILWDVSGKAVHTQRLSNGSNSIETALTPGLYLYGVTVNGTPKWTGKISVGTD